MKSYLEFKSDKMFYSGDVRVVGGWHPFASIVSKLHEADEPESKTLGGFKSVNRIPEVSKAIITFDEDDIAYLYQFPPEFHVPAMQYRYGDLLIRTHKHYICKGDPEGQPEPDRSWSEILERLQKVPDEQTIELSSGRTKQTFHIHTGIRKLYEKLCKPVDYDLLSKLSPSRKGNYPSHLGIYGFNFRNIFMGKDEDGTEIPLSDGYVFMNMATARKCVRDWREGSSNGILVYNAQGHRVGPEHMIYRSIGRMGGSEANAKRPYITATGEIKPSEERAIADAHYINSMMSRVGRMVKSGVEHGVVSFRDRHGVEFTGHQPLYLAGQLLRGEDVAQVEAANQRVAELMKEGKENEARDIAAKHVTALQTLRRHDALEYVISTHQKSTPEEGEKVTNLYSKVRGSGTFFPNKEQVGQHPGKKKWWRILRPSLCYDKLNLAKWEATTVDFTGRSFNRSAMLEGIKYGLYDVSNPDVKDYLKENINVLWMVILRSIISNCGDPAMKDYADTKYEIDRQNAGKSQAELNELYLKAGLRQKYQNAWDDVFRISQYLVKSFAQLSFPKKEGGETGTRRERKRAIAAQKTGEMAPVPSTGSTDVQMGDKEGGTLGSTVATDAKTALLAQQDAREKAQRERGQKARLTGRELRSRLEGSDAELMMVGHNIQTMRKLSQQAQVESEADEKGDDDEYVSATGGEVRDLTDAMKLGAKESAQQLADLFDMYKSQYYAQELLSSPEEQEAAEKQAMAYAREQLKVQLAKKGIEAEFTGSGFDAFTQTSREANSEYKKFVKSEAGGGPAPVAATRKPRAAKQATAPAPEPVAHVELGPEAVDVGKLTPDDIRSLQTKFHPGQQIDIINSPELPRLLASNPAAMAAAKEVAPRFGGMMNKVLAAAAKIPAKPTAPIPVPVPTEAFIQTKMASAKNWFESRLREMCGTGVVAPHLKKGKKGHAVDYNIWGAPGANASATPDEGPVTAKKHGK